MQHKATYCWKKFSKWIKVKLALGLINYSHSGHYSITNKKKSHQFLELCILLKNFTEELGPMVIR